MKANFIGDAKSLATVNVAAGAVEGVRHQVIFGGRTNRVHPICLQPVHQQVTHTTYGIALELRGHAARNGKAH